jgi:hypothetical protein
MKKIIIACFICLGFFNLFAKPKNDSILLVNYCSPPNDSLIINYINALNLESYMNKPLDSLLNSFPFPVQEYHFVNSKKCRIRMVYIYFSESIALTVWVDQYQYMNPVDCRLNYDFTLFRKEKVSSAIFDYKNKIIKIAGN